MNVAVLNVISCPAKAGLHCLAFSPRLKVAAIRESNSVGGELHSGILKSTAVRMASHISWRVALATTASMIGSMRLLSG